MATTDFDPQFARALRLMHSKSKDSEEQLRNMLEELIKQRHGSSKTLANTVIKKEITNKRETSKTATTSTSGHKDDFRKDNEKKSFDEIEESAKPFMTRSEPASPLQQDDDDELALEILEEDLTCVVCRGMDVVARNQLVECVECHSLYHQECHQPPVAEADMNDPRSAWYCSDCTKTMNKVQGSSKQASASGTQSPFGSTIAASNVKASFSSTTSKSSSNTSPTYSSSSKSFGGLPPPTTKSTSISVKQSSHSSSSQKVVMPNINIISADKRLQIMKKKAAKMQEKRKHSK